MAPEQAAGKKQLTTAVDVYGVGTILYELLTGQPPFSAPTLVETLRLVLDKDPARPHTLNPRLDRDLETICLKCLEKDPVKRYASAEALAEDLDYWLSGEPIEGRRSRIWERALKWAKRNRMVTALAGVIAMALLGMIGLMVILWVSAEKRAMAVGEWEIAEARVLELEPEKIELERENENLHKRIVEIQDQNRHLLTELDAAVSEIHIFRGDMPHAIYSSYAGVIYAAAISPDEKQIAFANDYSPMRILEITSGREMRSFLSDSPILANSAAYSHDGKYLAAGGQHGILSVWLAENGKIQLRLSELAGGIYKVVFSPDDKLLATASWPETVRLYDRFSGKPLWSTKGPEKKDQPGYIPSVAFRPDGKRLAWVGPRGTVNVWEVDTGREVLSLKIGDGNAKCESALFSADGLQLICASYKEVSVRDANTGEASLSLQAIHAPIALSADGKFLAAGFGDHQIKVMDTKTWKDIVLLPGTFPGIKSLTFSRTCKYLVGIQSGSPRKVLVWDLQPAKQQATAKGAEALMSEAEALMSEIESSNGTESKPPKEMKGGPGQPPPKPLSREMAQDKDKKDAPEQKDIVINSGEIVGKVTSIDANEKSFHLQVGKQDVKVMTIDDVKIRTKNPPVAYDDKGKIRKYTAKKLKVLKGDSKLPGYLAEFYDLRANQIVQVSLVHKKSNKTTQPLASVILIISEPN
jgi:WD40 repeat protein